MDRSQKPDTPGQAKVLPIRGWVESLTCEPCGSADVVQIDLIECEYPVAGVRRPGGVVVLDMDRRRIDDLRVGYQFFRCRSCGHEWPVPADLLFADIDSISDREPERSGRG